MAFGSFEVDGGASDGERALGAVGGGSQQQAGTGGAEVERVGGQRGGEGCIGGVVQRVGVDVIGGRHWRGSGSDGVTDVGVGHHGGCGGYGLTRRTDRTDAVGRVGHGVISRRVRARIGGTDSVGERTDRSGCRGSAAAEQRGSGGEPHEAGVGTCTRNA